MLGGWGMTGMVAQHTKYPGTVFHGIAYGVGVFFLLLLILFLSTSFCLFICCSLDKVSWGLWVALVMIGWAGREGCFGL